MLRLQSISLVQFRNYVQKDFSLLKELWHLRANGTGKTNLLDAIYYWFFTQLFFKTR